MNPFAAALAFIKHEPAILISLAGAGVGVGAAFGLHLDPNQTKEVYAAVAAVSGVLLRSTVTPSSSVAKTTAQLESRLTELETVVNRLVPAADLPVVEEVESVADDALKEAVAAQGPSASATATPQASTSVPVAPTVSVPAAPAVLTDAEVAAVEAAPSPTPTDPRWALL